MGLDLYTKPLSHKEQKFYLYLESRGINSFKVSEIDEKKLNLSRDYLYVMVNRLEKKD